MITGSNNNGVYRVCVCVSCVWDLCVLISFSMRHQLWVSRLLIRLVSYILPSRLILNTLSFYSILNNALDEITLRVRDSSLEFFYLMLKARISFPILQSYFSWPCSVGFILYFDFAHFCTVSSLVLIFSNAFCC